MMLARLNTIATRIAVAIVLAIIFGMAMMTFTILVVNHRDHGTQDDASHLLISRSGIGIIRPRYQPMMLSGRIAVVIRALASSPAAERQNFIAALAEPELKVTLGFASHRGAADDRDDSLDRLYQLVLMQIETVTPTISLKAYRQPNGAGQPTEAVIEAVFPDGQSGLFAIPGYPPRSANGLIVFIVSLIIVGGLVSFGAARHISMPISAFAAAAERLSVDLTAPSLNVRGPSELRAAITSVNKMQHRLTQYLTDRTQMLAAMSHDLRAPLARLRLRTELVTDLAQRSKIYDDLDAMNVMIDTTLAFARDEIGQEPRVLVDLGILIGDICEDMSDAGSDISYAAQRDIDIFCRPSLIRRAATNLIDNAIKYGGRVCVDIICNRDCVVITIEDEGPGIPLDEQEQVFAPFYRRETTRDPSKPGVGLGLSIARTIAREHGGDVTLSNRGNVGLRAVIELPTNDSFEKIRVAIKGNSVDARTVISTSSASTHEMPRG